MAPNSTRSRAEARAPRSRRPGSVDDLQALVSQLIKENQQLKRQLDRQSSKPATETVDAKVLVGLARKLERALTPSKPVRAVKVIRRRPVSPEVAERRRQALAKARAVRAEKRAAAAQA